MNVKTFKRDPQDYRTGKSMSNGITTKIDNLALPLYAKYSAKQLYILSTLAIT